MPTPNTTKGQIGHGFVLEYSDDASFTSPTAVAEILDIKPCKLTSEKVKIQTNDSGTLFGETILGWDDASDMEVDVVYERSRHATVRGLRRLFKYWRFKY